VGPTFLLIRVLRLLGFARLVAVAIAVYLWRKQRTRSAASGRTGRGSAR
jgi:hypothetical protein